MGHILLWLKTPPKYSKMKRNKDTQKITRNYVYHKYARIFVRGHFCSKKLVKTPEMYYSVMQFLRHGISLESLVFSCQSRTSQRKVAVVVVSSCYREVGV